MPPPPGPDRRLITGIIAIVAAVILIPVIALFTVWIVVAGSVDGDGSAPPPAPTASPFTDDTDGADTPDEPAGGQVEASLQLTIDEYRAALSDGSIWRSIPDTEFNRTAVTAFLYLITDMKLAASFGGDTTGYLDLADELERKLLQQEPLGTDISITLSDRTFTYDGDTGEGGFTPN